ncbi:MAG: hypothetical protein LUG83_06475, partial [Lachnospiraceae bacterium]|nr:hypothetical protein [Lachnospiraceae bacterium]
GGNSHHHFIIKLKCHIHSPFRAIGFRYLRNLVILASAYLSTAALCTDTLAQVAVRRAAADLHAGASGCAESGGRPPRWRKWLCGERRRANKPSQLPYLKENYISLTD